MPEVKEKKAEKKEEAGKKEIKKAEKDASTLVEEKPKEEIKTDKEPAPARPTEGKVFTIPMRKAFRKSEKKRKNYAILLIRDFLVRHTKAEELKIGSELHKAVWEKGNPPRKVRIKAVRDGPVVKAELLGFEYKDFKALPKQEKKGVKD